MMVRAMTSTAYRRVASLGSAGSFLLVLRLLGALVSDEESFSYTKLRERWVVSLTYIITRSFVCHKGKTLLLLWESSNTSLDLEAEEAHDFDLIIQSKGMIWIITRGQGIGFVSSKKLGGHKPQTTSLYT